MSYIKAKDILPKEILDLIQIYIDGEYLYIPRKESNKKSWGDRNKSKVAIQARNKEILEKYIQGIPVNDLADIYFLSPKTIYKIISNYNKSS
ncbi:hypothetical protein GPJ60_06395 [Clostridium sporogenes]|uniref:helix-turn-helix domain-containing protein n=1 Tax=Clostridium sporogenes TaxID=1509 RepID=UPI001C60BF7B|nr:helix-turn-helix domain-containing protein [Clostridium sporogenes]MBW5457091.1 hypothetical protein [Clostridium sporogenes]